MGNTASSGVSKSELTSLKNTVASLKSQLDKLQKEDPSKRIAEDVAKSVDYSELSKRLNMSAISEEVLKNPTEISKGVTDALMKDESRLASIASSLKDNPTFAKTVSDRLVDTSDKYRDALRGDKGPAGELLAGGQASVRSNLFDKGYTMWCADGEMCKLPLNKKGVDIDKSNFIHFGTGYTKEDNAGKIGYGIWDGGENGTLNILGAGKAEEVRRVRVW